MGGVVGEDGRDLRLLLVSGCGGVRWGRGWCEALAGGGWEGVLGGGYGGRSGLRGIRFGRGGDLLDGQWRDWRAAARAALVVDDLAQAAVLEEDVLAGDQAVGGAGERVGEREDGG